MKEKAEKKAMKAVIGDFRANQRAEKKAERERIAEKKKRKEENRKKSTITQVIRNPAKLKKLSRKQRAMVRWEPEPDGL